MIEHYLSPFRRLFENLEFFGQNIFITHRNVFVDKMPDTGFKRKHPFISKYVYHVFSFKLD